MKAILIGGTPGTGKTKVANILAERTKRRLIAMGALAQTSGCVKEYDAVRDTGVIDEDCLVEAIIDALDVAGEDVILEGHYIDLVPSEYVSDVFILRTRPSVLEERLRNRGYSPEKIKENVESEIIGVCQMDAIDSFGEKKVKEIDTSEMSYDEIIEQILEMRGKKGTSVRIDWMTELEEAGVFDDYFSDS
jgi:adenylate kinase